MLTALLKKRSMTWRCLTSVKLIQKQARPPALSSTVDVKNASYKNSIGAVSWSLVWEDPAFDPTQQSFYYVRVIEIPTPRWTAYDAKFFDTPASDEIPMITQERVYSSPIWYQP